MRIPGRKLRVLFLAGMATLGLLALVSMLGPGVSQADDATMHNCPQPSRWAVVVWGGDDGTNADQAFATCGEGAVVAAYDLDPQTQGWLRWFADQPGISTLSTLNKWQGVIALGGAAVALPPEPSPTAVLSGGFEVRNISEFYTGDGTFHVLGEVVNRNPFNASLVKVTGTFFDASGFVLAKQSAFSCVGVMAPGQDSPFDMSLENAPVGIVRSTLEVEGSETILEPVSGLDISEVSTQVVNGGFHISGVISNSSAVTYSLIRIWGALYGDGEVVSIDFAFTDFHTLEPGQKTKFELAFPDSPAAAYRLWPDAFRP
jgi:hypothetical protein